MLERGRAAVRVDPSQTLEIVVKFGHCALEGVITREITFSTTSTQKVNCVSIHGMRRDALTAVDRQRYLEDPALAAAEDPGVFP